jgi:Family of unknown function (DUF5681)
MSSPAFVRKILKEKVTIREGDRTRTMSKLELIHFTQILKAIKGDSKAYKALVEMIRDDPTLLDPPPVLQLIFTDDIEPGQTATFSDATQRRGKSSK